MQRNAGGVVSLPPQVLESVPEEARPSFVAWWSSQSLSPDYAPTAAALVRWGWPLDPGLLRLVHVLWNGPPLHEDVLQILRHLRQERVSQSGMTPEGPGTRVVQDLLGQGNVRERLENRLRSWLNSGLRIGEAPLEGLSGVQGLLRLLRESEEGSGAAGLRNWLWNFMLRKGKEPVADDPGGSGEGIPVFGGSGETVAGLLVRWRNGEAQLPHEVSRAVDRVLTALTAQAGLAVTGSGQPWVYQCLFLPVMVGARPQTLLLHVWRWARQSKDDRATIHPCVITWAWRFARFGYVEAGLAAFGSSVRLHLYGEEEARRLLSSLPWSTLENSLSNLGLRLASVSVEPLKPSRRSAQGPPLSPWDMGWLPRDRFV
ncbi:MAG: hypothetical protein IRY98_02315 [Alicyclobacillaceae bacterium]|nr:hypothetical protein [Alicyclobacillaceae bacterium]